MGWIEMLIEISRLKQPAPKQELFFAGCRRMATRKRPRMRDGFLKSNHMAFARGCAIRDISATGAQLNLWDETVSSVLLNGELSLYLCAERMEVYCRTVWRKGELMGVRFISEHRPASAPWY
jgi:hypothetical protein